MLRAQAIELSGAGSGVSRVGVPSSELTVGVSLTAAACGETSIIVGAAVPSLRSPGPWRESVVGMALGLLFDRDGDGELERRERLGVRARAPGARRVVVRGESERDGVGDREDAVDDELVLERVAGDDEDGDLERPRGEAAADERGEADEDAERRRVEGAGVRRGLDPGRGEPLGEVA